jgi:hypothetical protein
MKYKIAYQPDLSLVYFSGQIDEHIGPVLMEIRGQVRGSRVVFDLAYLTQVNSIGVATWLAHIKSFDDLQLSYENCPNCFSSLWLMIPGFGGKGTLDSLFAHYYCNACDDGTYHKTVVKKVDCVQLGDFPPLPCPVCRGAMKPEMSDQELLHIFVPDA